MSARVTGQGCVAPTGKPRRWAVGELSSGSFPKALSPGQGVTSTAVSYPLPLQGHQDHYLPAVQLAPQLVSLLLGIGLPGHRLHSLGV